MPDDVVIGLKSVSLKGSIGKPGYTPIMQRSPDRIFTEDEQNYLKSLPTEVLWTKYNQGANLVKIWSSESIINLTRGESAKMASNMRYQMDFIMSIIRKRTEYK